MARSSIGDASSPLESDSSEARLLPDSVLVRTGNLPEAKLSDDEIVILDLNQGKYYGMSGSGLRIWALLEAETTLHALSRKLATEFDVSEDLCLEETLEFVGKLLRENLVRIVPQR